MSEPMELGRQPADTGRSGAPSEAQENVDLALRTLSPEERTAFAATVVQSLDTPDQQRAAAEGVVGALPNQAKQDLATTVVRSLDTLDQQRAAAESVVRSLPSAQREQVAQELGIGRPDQKTRQYLWMIVVCTMAAALFVFGSMAFVLIYQGKGAEAPLALATTALGALVGLIATSPGSQSRNG